MQPDRPRTVKNILFIMADQLRRDYLSCYGSAPLSTPHIDALASRGVRFTRAYAQGAVCGVSRMSYYTGRYMSSHGATWNFVPLPLQNRTMGDHLSPLGLRVAVVGKTHFTCDRVGLARGGADLSSAAGSLAAEGGFEPYERDDGIWPGSGVPRSHRYSNYLRERGYRGPNPWHDWANSARGPAGEILSGWSMRWSRLPAAVEEQDSETAYTTRRAIEFMDECGEQPWCLHLSYIKPHWPYVAPAPYHEQYGPDDVPAPMRSDLERIDPHPVLRGFQAQGASRAFSDNSKRRCVVPTYMGLVKQLDDQLGSLFAHLSTRGLWANTLVVFCSDHGDYLGDHWLGEKELFHDTSVAVPLIVCHPGPDALRGVAVDRLVEAIDLLPTFIESVGGVPPAHQLEGRSLLPLMLTGAKAVDWRQFAVSEGDYGFRRPVRIVTGQPIDACRMFMVRTDDWKYVHYEGLPAQLFDLREDPLELFDRGRDAALATVRGDHGALLFDWLRKRSIHSTVTEREMDAMSANEARHGIHIGKW